MKCRDSREDLDMHGEPSSTEVKNQEATSASKPPAHLLGREQINPCRGIELRPVGIPGEPKNIPIRHTLKFSETSLLHTPNRRHIVTEDKNQGPSPALLAAKVQNLLQERRIEILAAILRKGKSIVEIHYVPTRVHDTTSFPDFDGLLGHPAIGEDFVCLLDSPKLLTTGKPCWKEVAVRDVTGRALHGPGGGIKHTRLHRQPRCTGGRCRSLQIDFKQAQ